MRRETQNGSSLEKARAVLGERLHVRREEIVEAIYVHVHEAVPHPMVGEDTEYQAGLRAAIAAVLEYYLEGIKHGSEWPGPVPLAAVAQARRAARVGVSVGTVLRRYLAAHRRFGDLIEDEAELSGFLRHGAAVHHLRRTQDGLLECVAAAIENEYNQECERISHRPEQRREQLARRLLAGPIDLPELAQMDYEINASWHVGVIATGASVEKVTRDLAAGLGRNLLPVLYDEESVWAWLGGQQRLAVAEVEHLVLTKMPEGVSLAIGEPGKGLEGWRLTHQQAQEALQVAQLKPQKITRYADIALLTPWLRDANRTQSLVEIFLSPLDGQRDGGAALRQTLRAYFATGHNVQKTAAKIKADRSTVRRRLRAIEQALDCPLYVRQAELEVAMRLEELYKISLGPKRVLHALGM